jgi:hypothetical protein
VAVEVVRKCDVCGEPGAHQWTLQTDGKKWEIDLDDEHAAPLLAVVEEFGKVESSAATGPGPHRDLDRTLATRIRGLPDQED